MVQEPPPIPQVIFIQMTSGCQGYEAIQLRREAILSSCTDV